MRFLHVIDSLAASGGAEQGLVREITRFAPGTEQSVVTLYDRNELAPRLIERGVAVESVGLPEGSGSRTWPKAVPIVERLGAAFRPDVIQTSLFLGNMVGQHAARRLGVPVVSNLVLSGDLEALRALQPGAGTWRAGLLRSLAGRAARRSDATFRALTDEVRESNARLLGVDPQRITVIPRGVPPPDDSPLLPRDQLGLPEGRLVVNVGRLAPQKGQPMLVEAIAIVREEVPDARLVIVGRDGIAADEVRAAVRRLGLEDSVTLVGHTDRVADYLRHASMFAFSSMMEGLGTAVLEAMSFGLPIAAFDIPPVREATQGGRFGDLVPPGDVPALARAIVGILGHGSPRRDDAAEFVLTHHDLGRVAGMVERLLVGATSGVAGPG